MTVSVYVRNRKLKVKENTDIDMNRAALHTVHALSPSITQLTNRLTTPGWGTGTPHHNRLLWANFSEKVQRALVPHCETGLFQESVVISQSILN